MDSHRLLADFPGAKLSLTLQSLLCSFTFGGMNAQSFVAREGPTAPFGKLSMSAGRPGATRLKVRRFCGLGAVGLFGRDAPLTALMVPKASRPLLALWMTPYRGHFSGVSQFNLRVRTRRRSTPDFFPASSAASVPSWCRLSAR